MKYRMYTFYFIELFFRVLRTVCGKYELNKHLLKKKKNAPSYHWGGRGGGILDTW